MILWLLLIFLKPSSAQEALANPRCNEWLDPGECNNFTVKWYYDRYDHRCREFYYSGCGGNSNNFNSLEECSSSCFFREPERTDRCRLPHDPGHCQSDIERWHFDINKKQCVCSWWSGCGGNENRYYSYNHCMEICGSLAEPGIGPGIDWEYWGRQNGPSLSPEVLQQFGLTQSSVDDMRSSGRQPVIQHQQQYHQQPQNQQSASQYSNQQQLVVGSAQQHHQAQYQSEGITSSDSTVANQREAVQNVEVHPAVPYAGYHSNNEAITYAEMRNSPEEIVFQPGDWQNITDENGNQIYQFSSKPQVTVSDNGRTTTNRSVLVILHPSSNQQTQYVSMPRINPTDYNNYQNQRIQSDPLMRKKEKMKKKQKIPPRKIYPTSNPDVNQQKTNPNNHYNQNNQNNNNGYNQNTQTQQQQQYYYQPVHQTQQMGPKEKYFFIRYDVNPEGRGYHYEKLSWTGLKNNPLIGLPVQYHRQVLDSYNQVDRRSSIHTSRPRLPQVSQPQQPVRPVPQQSRHQWTPAITPEEASRYRQPHHNQQPSQSYARPSTPRPTFAPIPHIITTPFVPRIVPTTTFSTSTSTSTTTTTTTTPPSTTSTTPRPVVSVPKTLPTPTLRPYIPPPTYPSYPRYTTAIPRDNRYPSPYSTTQRPIEHYRPLVDHITTKPSLTMEEIIEIDGSKNDDDYEEEVPGQFFRILVKSTTPPRPTQIKTTTTTPSPPVVSTPTDSSPLWKQIVLPPTKEEENFDFEINVIGE